MVEIFNEEREPGSVYNLEVFHATGIEVAVHRNKQPIHASVIACYDDGLRVLVVDCRATTYDERFSPMEWRLMETHQQQSDAIRRAVAIADEWYKRVEAEIPTYPTDETILAEYGTACAQHGQAALVHYGHRYRYPFTVDEEAIPF